jgi:hypothetical protein
MDFAVLIWLFFVLLIIISSVSFAYYLQRYNRIGRIDHKEQELLARTFSQINKKDIK